MIIEETKETKEFILHKKEYLKTYETLQKMESEKVKYLAVISALEQEEIELEQKLKSKKDNYDNFSIDFFIEIKKEKAELDARLEFNRAYLEEIELKILEIKTNLYNKYQAIHSMRGDFLYSYAKSLLDNLLEQHKDAFSEIFKCLQLSGRITPPINSENTIEEQVKIFMGKELGKSINTDFKINDDFLIPVFVKQYETLTPTKAHALEHSKEKKGFAKLFNKL